MSDKDKVKQAAIDALSRPAKKTPSIAGKPVEAKTPANPVKSNKTPVKSQKPKTRYSSQSRTGSGAKTGTGTATGKKEGVPEKGSAEAEAHRQAAKAASIRLSEPEPALPQKGGAEAAVHNMASKAASTKSASTKSASTKSASSQNSDGGGFGFLFLVLFLPLAIVGGLYAYATHIQEKGKKTVVADGGKTAGPAAPGPSAGPAAAKIAGNEKDKPATPAPPAKTGADKSARVKTDPTKSDVKNSGTDKSGTHKTVAAKTVTAATGLAKTGAAKSATATATKTAQHGEKTAWDYKMLDWATLDPAYKTCGEGASQSPIDIPAPRNQAGPNFQFNYFPASGTVRNTGHSIQVDLAKSTNNVPNQLLVNGKAYQLIHFHFHTPAEHRISGRSFPMEAQLVHKNEHGQLAIVAVMITTGFANDLIDRMPVPAKKGDYSKSGGAHINPALLLPSNRRALTFTGSLTTPPCTENVGWIVMQTPITVSPATLAKFHKVSGKNNRPLQPVNGRMIFSSN